jgi:hypothetical protein
MAEGAAGCKFDRGAEARGERSTPARDAEAQRPEARGQLLHEMQRRRGETPTPARDAEAQRPEASRRGQLLHEMQFEISRPPGLGACCYSETQTRNPDSSIFYRFPDSRAWSRIQNRNLRESSVRISEHADDSGRRFQHLVRFSVNAEDSGRRFVT